MIDTATLGPLIAEEPRWPDPLAPEAFHGPVGEIVKLIAPQTEADPAALLVTMLVMAGNAIDRGPHFRVEADRHGTALFAVLVGDTASGKGVSAGWGKEAVFPCDLQWATERVVDGLSTGEGLIHAVRDPVVERRPAEESEMDRADLDGMIEDPVDPGVDDKRLMVRSGEMAQTFAVMRREQNTLSAILRSVFDEGRGQSLTKSAPTRTTRAHVSILGHITAQELAQKMTSTEAANGFANRFLWIAVKRARRLPLGGKVDELELNARVGDLRKAIEKAKDFNQLTMTPAGEATWVEAYGELTRDREGLFGAICGRAHAITLRLSVLYAALDGTKQIDQFHVAAALAVWRRAEESAAYLFDGQVGDRLADRLLRILEQAGTEGIRKSEIRDRLGSHAFTADRINQCLNLLREQGRAEPTLIETGSAGRNPEVWRFLPMSAYPEGGAA